MLKKLSILGSTGSIGCQTLDIVKKNPDKYEVTSLTAGKNIELLAAQINEFNPGMVAISRANDVKELENILKNKYNKSNLPKIFYGMDGFITCATDESDTVVGAMVGMIGIRPVYEAILKGKNIALANKETLVTAGEIIMNAAGKMGVSILPVDSEHSAIFQSLRAGRKQEIEKIWLTASGGPFLTYSEEELKNVTKEDALKHPNWSMGKKITIDSATMVNKGLEIIEACYLFDVDPEDICVLVQKESVIHSMVEYRDGSVIAQIGPPDMRIPIQYALSYPKRLPLEVNRLNFHEMSSISFAKPNKILDRGMELARESFNTGGNMASIMNAANEYAVYKFLKDEIGFLDIYKYIEYAMEKMEYIKKPSLDDIIITQTEVNKLLDCYSGDK